MVASLIRIILVKQKGNFRASISNNLDRCDPPEQGLTILECLIAILVISSVLVMIAPPMLLAVATRVQNQKVEQALQLAQAEIERIRLKVDSGNYKNDNSDLPPQSSASTFSETDTLTECDSDQAKTTLTKGLTIDMNNDGTTDYVVQTFRDAGKPISATNSQLITFQMGVRVYSYGAFKDCNTTPNPSLTKTAPALRMMPANITTSPNPLAVLYARVTRGDLKESYGQYKDALK